MSVNNIYANAPTGGGPAVTTPTTSVKPPCNPSYISIPLKKGEKFILPAGATIVSSTAGSNVLTSKDNCADLTKIETPKDYYLRFSVIERDGGSATSNFERRNISADAIVINNVTTVFAACNWDCMVNGADLINKMNTILPVFTFNWSSLKDDNAHNAGQTILISFKTIPSIAKTLYVRWTTGTFWQDGFPDATFYTKATTDEGGRVFP